MQQTLATLLLISVAIAQDQPEPSRPAEKAAAGAFGIDFTTAYYFRGIFQENQGLIAQPWIELGYGLYEGDGLFRNLDLRFGIWNSLHNGPSGSAGGNASWYENDFYVGLSGKVSEQLSVGTTYTSYYSPNGSFRNVQEIAFSANYDDRAEFADYVSSGLQPSLTIAIELAGQAENRNPNNAPGNRGVYLQAGIEPTMALGNLGQLDVTLTLPVTLGLGLKDYYEDANGRHNDFFGFLDLGAALSTPLPFLPSRMGPWDAHVDLHLLLLGDNNEQRNGGDAAELILSLGMSTTF